MDDLISKSAAIEALKDAMCMTGYQSRAIDAVRFLPTIDAEPVRHGRWILVGADKRGRGGVYNCTACNSCRPFKSTYCPNCGAKMDLKEE